MSSRKTSARPVQHHRVQVENEMIRRREKEYKHQEQWGGRVQYYKTFEKNNNKLEQWTSPRYYTENTQLTDKLRKERDKAELLVKRRERLLKLFQEEEASQKIELMVVNRDSYTRQRPPKPDDIPTEILKEINAGLKLEEEDRRRHMAEANLYKHWRQNSHAVRNYERDIRNKDVKLSWLDQQIQKRMEREKAEEDCRKMLSDREQRLKAQQQEEERFKRDAESKNKLLQYELQKQMDELREKQRAGDELKRKEEEDTRLMDELDRFDDLQLAEDERRKKRETALYNLTQHKMKLKQKAKDIEENLEHETRIAREILDLAASEKLANDAKKQETGQMLREFLQYAEEQKKLEKQRQNYLDFVFDSEAKHMYEQQEAIWRDEENTRRLLLKDVLESIRLQVKEKEERNRSEYLKVLAEREGVLREVEKYNDELEELRREEMARGEEYRNIIGKQIKERDVKRRQLQSLRQRDIDKELEIARKEEERLKAEIITLQRRQGPPRHPRSRIVF